MPRSKTNIFFGPFNNVSIRALRSGTPRLTNGYFGIELPELPDVLSASVDEHMWQIDR